MRYNRSMNGSAKMRNDYTMHHMWGCWTLLMYCSILLSRCPFEQALTNVIVTAETENPCYFNHWSSSNKNTHHNNQNFYSNCRTFFFKGSLSTKVRSEPSQCHFLMLIILGVGSVTLLQKPQIFANPIQIKSPVFLHA